MKSLGKKAVIKMAWVLILAVVVVAAAGGYYYYQYIWLEQQKPKEITVWWSWEVLPAEQVRKFEEQNNAKVHILVLGDELRDKLVSGFATGEVADVFAIDGCWVCEWVARGLLEPIPSDIADEFTRTHNTAAFVNGAVKGTLYAVTFDISNHILMYNVKHFIDSGLDPNRPPETVEELREYAKKLARWDEKGNLMRAGFLINRRDFYFGDLIHSHDGSLYNEDHNGDPRDGVFKATFNDAIGRRVIRNVVAMYLEDKTADYTWALPETFLANKTSMMIVWGPGWILDILALDQPLEVRFAPIPGETPHSGTGGMAYAVYKNSPNKDLAYKFLAWTVGKDAKKEYYLNVKKQTALAEVSQTTLELQNDPDLFGDWPTEVKGARIQPREEMQAACSILDPPTGVPPWVRPKTIHYAEIHDNIWNPWMEKILLGQVSWEEGIEQMVTEVNKVLEKGETP